MKRLSLAIVTNCVFTTPRVMVLGVSVLPISWHCLWVKSHVIHSNFLNQSYILIFSSTFIHVIVFCSFGSGVRKYSGPPESIPNCVLTPIHMTLSCVFFLNQPLAIIIVFGARNGLGPVCSVCELHPCPLFHCFTEALCWIVMLRL